MRQTTSLRRLLQAGWATLLLAALFFVGAPAQAQALDQLCDTAFENCRTPLLNLIKNETVAIDVGMWFMEDARFSAELVKRKQAGVPIRILMDPRSNIQHPVQPAILDQLASGGIPMRNRIAKGIEHWKIMIFEGQGVLYFGSANFSEDGFVTATPYVNYVDELIYFTDNVSLLQTFQTRFDDAWTNTKDYADYANPQPLARRYPTYPIDPEVNTPPGEDFINRTVARINAERQQIDVMMYRIDDERATSALINAHNRGIPVRLIVAPDMYHDVTRPTISFHFDRLFMAGIPMKFTVHEGINHGKLSMYHGQGMTIFGSSNWTTPSANSQHENNLFTTKGFIFDYFQGYFNRRWDNSNPVGATETGPFVPLPPDKPLASQPMDLATGVSTTSVRLKWNGGLWGQYYDIYFGTSPDPPLFAANRFLGPTSANVPTQSFQLPTLAPGETYFWKIVSRTAANLTRTSNVFSFTTAPAPPPPPPGASTIVIRTGTIPAADIHGDWAQIADPSAADGFALHNPDRGRGKVAPARSSPANYFEVSFNAPAGVPYHLWIRMRAQNNSASNDSIHAQFSDSVDGSGGAIARIGTAASFEPVLVDGPDGGALSGWGWTDNGWGALGPHIYFAADGRHVLRIQQREDGTIIDQIVLSPDTFIMSPPGPHDHDDTILPGTTGSEPPPPPAGTTIVLWTANLASEGIHGDWVRTADASAAGGFALQNPDRARAKIAPALVSPPNYFEIAFDAPAAVRYHLWVRMRAQNNSLSNDSVHVQFSDAVDSVGNPIVRIGSAVSWEPVLQDGPSGVAPHGWGWTDNGWGAPGPNLYFENAGTHVIRVQQREDGAIIDQIVLSPDSYVTSAPGPHLDDTTILPSTGGSAPPPPPPPPPPPNDETVVLWTADIPAFSVHGSWQPTPDPAAAGGTALRNADLGAAKLAPALQSPQNYIEASFTASAGRAYRVWLRMRADGDSLANDSVHVQFNDSVTSTGNPFARIGSSGSAEFVLQAGPSGASPQGWGWTDNGWGAPGADIYFAASGVHTVRIQQREDGVTIDQIVISPDTFLSAPPGARAGDTTVLERRGSAPPPQPPSAARTIVLWPSSAASLVASGSWQPTTDSTAAGGTGLWNPNANAAKIAPALISPVNFFELSFTAEAATAYHIWVRMRAEGNDKNNDSVHVQFTDSVDAAGAPFAQIGTASSAEVVLQAGSSGALPRGWGWGDNSWDAAGPNFFFASGGVKTLRVQQREDGPIIDQIVISPDAYLSAAPGARRDDAVILPAQQP